MHVNEAAPDNPATRRLAWVIDVLNAPMSLTEDMVTAHIGHPLIDVVPPSQFVADISNWSRQWAPIVLEQVEEERLEAVRIFSTADGGRAQVRCTVAADPPNLITGLRFGPAEESYPPLPDVFDDFELPSGRAADDARPSPQLIVFCGVPGVGKTTLANHLARELGFPVFAFDWLLGALTRFDILKQDSFRAVGYELLTTLAVQHLLLGQSVILDSPADDESMRKRWTSLAMRFSAKMFVVECVCPDRREHETRVLERSKGVPGWRESNWTWVEQRLAIYRSWEGALSINTLDPVEANLSRLTQVLGVPSK